MARVLTTVETVRARFTALQQPLAFFDGPGGTQVPDSVIDAIATYLRESNANLGGPFATSRESDALVDHAHETAAEFLNATADEVAFGANMTTLNFALSRAAVARLAARATRSSARGSTTTATSRRGSSSRTTTA